jgi:hypothetical protein
VTSGKSPSHPDDAWSSATFAGAEREQLRVWSRLPLRRKLEALEEMCEHARRTLASRRDRGLPYIEPFTGEAVGPRPPAETAVREDLPGDESGAR